MTSKKSERGDAAGDPRRRLVSRGSGLAMMAGLVGGYGAFAWLAGRFLYPARARETRRLDVTETARMREGDSLPNESSTGAQHEGRILEATDEIRGPGHDPCLAARGSRRRDGRA